MVEICAGEILLDDVAHAKKEAPRIGFGEPRTNGAWVSGEKSVAELGDEGDDEHFGA